MRSLLGTVLLLLNLLPSVSYAQQAINGIPNQTVTLTGMLNVKNYGVKGDGSTVDGPAIIALMTAQPTTTLYFPAATYVLSNAAGANGLAIPSTFVGTVFMDPGAKFACNTNTTSAGNCIHLTNGFNWYGGTVTYTSLSGIPLARASSTAYAVVSDPGTVTNMTIQNVKVIGSTGPCVWFGASTNVTVINLQVSSCTADGLHFDNNTNVQVHGYTSLSTGDDGLAFTSATGQTLVCGGTVDDVYITNSKSRGLVVVGGCDITFSNFVVGPTSVAALYAGQESGFNATSHVKYSNGFVIGSGTFSGLSGDQYGIDIPGTGSSYVDVDNVTVIGSQDSALSIASGADHINIRNSRFLTPVTNNGMKIIGCTHCQISDNTIDTTVGYGVYNQSSNDVTFSNLNIRNCFTTTGLNRAFWTSTAAGPVTVNGINVVDDQSTATCTTIGGDTNSSFQVNVIGINPTIAHGTFGLAPSGSIQEVYEFLAHSQKAILSGNYTNATTTFSNVSNFSNVALPLQPAQNAQGYCMLYYQASAATAGPKIEFTGPASPATVVYVVEYQTSVAAGGILAPAAAVAYSSALSAGTSVTASTSMQAIVHFSIQNGATAGTLQLLAASQGTGTLTIGSGSFCAYQ